MSAFPRQTQSKGPAQKNAVRLEQFTLSASLCGAVVLVVGSLSYGLYIASDLVITNGIFSLFSLFGSGLKLAAAKLVARPADNRFQYGYWHLEPLVLFINALLLCCICVYAAISSIETIRLGGRVVDAAEVIRFGVASGILCGAIWLMEVIVARRTGSNLLRSDSKEWLMDFLSSMITLAGFAALRWLEEPWYGLWARYADSILILVLVLLFAPIPVHVLISNIREILLITTGDDPVSLQVGEEAKRIQSDYPGVVSCFSHVVKVGRSYFVEVSILVTPEFPLQSVAQQDYLRKRLWDACGKEASELWLVACVTEEERWS